MVKKITQFIAIALIFLLGAIGCKLHTMAITDSPVLEELQQQGIVDGRHFMPYRDSLQIQYVTTGTPSAPLLLLIHGSPGSWSDWQHIIANDTVRQRYFIVALTRPGYGFTTVPPQASLEEQAAVVWHLITQLGYDSAITVVGHSYGGAVAMQLLSQYPPAFRQGILIAPTLGAALMAPRWYNKVAAWRPVNQWLSADLRHSNIEMTGLPASLRKLENNWQVVQAPIIYIQGERDILVSPKTVDFMRSHYPGPVRYVVVKKMNHFVPWSDPQLITKALLETAPETESK